LSGYIFATKAHIDNRKKKLVKQQYVLQMSPQYGKLRPTGSWDWSGSWSTPANFNGFHILAALLHGSQVVSVSQTLRHWTEGATYCSAGRPSRWALSHISSLIILYKISPSGAIASELFCNRC